MTTQTAPIQQHDFRRMAEEEHRQAELLRLKLGIAGCGCADCQDLYRTLDMTQYGPRVQRHDGMFYVTGRLSMGDTGDDTEDSPTTASDAPPDSQQGCAKKQEVSTTVATAPTPGIMAQAPVEPPPAPADATPPKKKATRGRPQRPGIPVERIRELSAAGQPSRAIAEMLKADGIPVSFRTVARVLAGERPLF